MPHLTDAACRSSKPVHRRDLMLRDEHGLYLRIRSGGTKVWVIEYMHLRQRRKVSIGYYDPRGSGATEISGMLQAARLSLSEARFIAATWKDMRRAGTDPAAEWRVSRKCIDGIAAASAKAAPRLREAVQRFMGQHMDGKKSARHIAYRLERLLAELGDRPIREITRQDVISAIEAIAVGRKKGRTAKLLAGEVLVAAKRLWSFCEAREWAPDGCLDRLRRAHFDARPRKREVALRLEEVAAVWRALGEPARCSADPITVAALQLLVLTGQRESEVAGAAWEEFDLSARIWRIPGTRTKNARPHLVHLAPPAVSILERLKAITGAEVHVFASPIKKGQSIYGRSINNALRMMFKRGALPTVTPCHVHDFRRTLISRLPDLGFDSFIGHKIANHTLPGVLGTYNHAEYFAERQAALYAWAEQIDNATVCLADSAGLVNSTRSEAPARTRNRRGGSEHHSTTTRTSSRPGARYGSKSTAISSGTRL